MKRRGSMTKIKEMFLSWWNNFTMSDDERYLSQSVDAADFERRLKNLINNNHSNLKGA
jgi:murein L,D-transpeptidase YafK